jgi:hypothetical protein
VGDARWIELDSCDWQYLDFAGKSGGYWVLQRAQWH